LRSENISFHTLICIFPTKTTHQLIYFQRFSIFGLGHSIYREFCSFAKFLDSRLTDLHALRLLPLALGDEKHDQADAFNNWLATILQTLHISSENQSSSTQYLIATERHRPFNLLDNLRLIHNRSILPGRLLSRQNLEDPATKQVTLLVEIEVTQGSLQYKPGDHVEIYSSHKASLVDQVLSRVDFSDMSIDQTFAIPTDDRFPVFSFREALTYYYDMTRPLAQGLYERLATQTSDPDEQKTLTEIGQVFCLGCFQRLLIAPLGYPVEGEFSQSLTWLKVNIEKIKYLNFFSLSIFKSSPIGIKK
jgi:sulfite reductase alpha subunit-like flavoprotein